MRVAITTATARIAGGAETYLAAVLPLLLSNGHELAILCEYEGPAGRNAIAGDVQLPIWRAHEIGRQQALSQLELWRPDIIFAQGLPSPELEAESCAIAPAVAFVHGYRGSCISERKAFSWPVAQGCTRRFGAGCLAYFYPRRCGGLNPATMWSDYRSELRRLEILLGSAKVLTASIHMRNVYLQLGLDPGRLRFIRYPVTAAGGVRPADGTSNGSSKLALPSRLLFAGRMEHLKGGSMLIDAMPRVVQALQRDIHLDMAGEGRERTVWAEKAGRVCAAERRLSIEFHGWLAEDELQAAYRAADALVMPSLWPEPFGLSGPEAGLHGVPAVAFAAGGIPEWLSDGVNGCMAPFNPPTAEGLAGAIVECLRDPVRHSRMRAAAVDLASRFSARQHLEELERIFVEAAGHSAAGPRPMLRTMTIGQ
ncbi:MAG: glycosyltransferase family 4 protein [Candidatus Binataceae bacterium]